MTDRRAQRTAILGAVKAGKITPKRAATWAKWVADGGDAAVLAAMVPGPGPVAPLGDAGASAVLEALDAHLPLPRGTAAAAGRLGDLDGGDAVYEATFGKDPARVSEHFESRRQATREAAAAQAAALTDDELFDQIFPPHEHN